MTWKMLEKVNVLLKGIRGNIKLTEEKVLSVTLLLEQFCILKIDKDTLINWWKQKGFKCYWIKKQIEPFHIKKFKLIIKVMQLILIMLIGIDVCDRMVFLWEETGVPSETQLSDLVTTWLSHMPTPGIKPGSQRWEASALTLRQPDIWI